MKLTTAKIYLTIAITSISLIGVVVIQYNWLEGALSLEQEKFSNRVDTLFTEIEDEIMSDCALSADLAKLVESACQDCGEYTSALPEDHAQQTADQVQGVIDSVFAAQNFSHEYELGIILPSRHEPADSRVVYASAPGLDPDVFKNSRHQSNRTGFLTLHFPEEQQYLTGQIMWLLGLSVMFILILAVCFGYVIVTIRRQKKLSEMKNDFINNLTHEFKTPIFSISLATKLLGKSEEVGSSPKYSSYLNLITNENKRLRAQVDKVLQMSLLDSANFNLSRKKVDLHSLIDQVCDTFSVILEEKGGKIHKQLEAENPELYTDETHLSNVIYNLIDNGIKYTADQPEITIATSDTGDGLCLRVKDNGIGIDREAQKHIFDKFYRVQTGDVHDVKGFGLGLSYVKRIVDAHRGLINLNSNKNDGTEFTITLPVN